MGQAKQRGSFEERRAQSLAARTARLEEQARLREESRRERGRQVEEARRLSPKFEALPPVLKLMVLAECAARGVEPLWLKPPSEPVPMTPLDARRQPTLGAWGLIALAAAIGGRF